MDDIINNEMTFIDDTPEKTGEITKQLPDIVNNYIDTGREVMVLDSEDETERFYFKKPIKPQIDKYLTKAQKGKVISAIDGLIQDTILYPKFNEFKTIVSNKPMRKVALIDSMLEELGVKEEFSVKKL